MAEPIVGVGQDAAGVAVVSGVGHDNQANIIASTATNGAEQTDQMQVIQPGQQVIAPGQEEQQEPAADPGVDWSKVNLSDIPQFRDYQSAFDKEKALLQQANIRTQQQAEQQMLALQQQLDSVAMSQLDDYGKLEYQSKSKDAENARIRQQYEGLMADMAKEQQLQLLSTQYGVPLEEINGTDPVAAHQSVIDWQAKEIANLRAENDQQKQQVVADKIAASNTLDLGSGETVSDTSGFQARYNKAMQNFDNFSADAVVQEAAEKGVRLDVTAWRRSD